MVATLRNLATKTVHSMAQAGDIPAFNMLGQWRTRHAAFDQQIDAKPPSGYGNDDGC